MPETAQQQPAQQQQAGGFKEFKRSNGTVARIARKPKHETPAKASSPQPAAPATPEAKSASSLRPVLVGLAVGAGVGVTVLVIVAVARRSGQVQKRAA